ncbi:unnamed protein product, partial [Vitis vinifera]|uniref:Uncharacterized protein n=1 Tax=Vitis vinifera TaxID=29760 RepID=D7SQI3_VITVI
MFSLILVMFFKSSVVVGSGIDFVFGFLLLARSSVDYGKRSRSDSQLTPLFRPPFNIDCSLYTTLYRLVSQLIPMNEDLMELLTLEEKTNWVESSPTTEMLSLSNACMAISLRLDGALNDKTANITACKDTFRGRVYECPLVDGVKFKGDSYSS